MLTNTATSAPASARAGLSADKLVSELETMTNLSKIIQSLNAIVHEHQAFNMSSESAFGPTAGTQELSRTLLTSTDVPMQTLTTPTNMTILPIQARPDISQKQKGKRNSHVYYFIYYLQIYASLNFSFSQNVRSYWQTGYSSILTRRTTMSIHRCRNRYYQISLSCRACGTTLLLAGEILPWSLFAINQLLYDICINTTVTSDTVEKYGMV